jgi:protein TonB
VPPLRLLLANGNGRGWRASLGLLLHTAVVAVLFLLPLLVTDEITGAPAWRKDVIYSIQKDNPQGSGLEHKRQPSGPKVNQPKQHAEPKLILPKLPSKPDGLGPINTAGPDIGLNSTGIPGGVESGETPASPPAIQQLFQPAPTEPTPVRVGGKVRQPRLLRRVEPVYPSVAKQAGIQGTVVLEATLGSDGRVESIRVIRGHPLLVGPAQQAVAQWVFEPTYLNDRPVPVLLQVTVEFILRR